MKILRKRWPYAKHFEKSKNKIDVQLHTVQQRSNTEMNVRLPIEK